MDAISFSRRGPAYEQRIGMRWRAGIAVAAALLLFPSPLSQQSAGDEWQTFENCPVLIDKVVEVPALESGVLDTFGVQLNQAVEAGQAIAQLDMTLAQMELQMARLQYDVAKRLAEDESDIQFHMAALRVVETELANLEKIGSSVSGTEMRRTKLSVEKAQQAVIRAQQARARSFVDAKLKAAAVDMSSKRLERCQVTAPLKGVVSKILRHPGQWVQAGEPILEIRNLDHLIVDRLLPIRGIDLTSIVGAPVRIAVKNLDGREVLLSGDIASYDHEVSSRGLVRVHARVANLQKDGHWVLLPGMTVKMYLSARHVRDPMPHSQAVAPASTQPSRLISEGTNSSN